MTPLYSPLPACAVDMASSLGVNVFDQDRDAYPPLPWPAEDTVGTEWRNVHTGDLVTIAALGHEYESDKGHLAPLYPFFGRLASIALWVGGRWVVEHWVRVDHLSPAVRLAWYGPELDHHRSIIRSCDASIAHMDAGPDKVACYNCNRTAAVKDRARHRAELDAARARLHAFADAHGLVVPLGVLNWTDPRRAAWEARAGAGAGGDGPAVQLALF